MIEGGPNEMDSFREYNMPLSVRLPTWRVGKPAERLGFTSPLPLFALSYCLLVLPLYFGGKEIENSKRTYDKGMIKEDMAHDGVEWPSTKTTHRNRLDPAFLASGMASREQFPCVVTFNHLVIDS